MNDVKNGHEKIKVHMPETSHMATKVLFVMIVVLGFLLIALFIMDKGREEAIQKYEALAAGIVATLPLQNYLTQYHYEHKNWPASDAALQAAEVKKPESVKTVAVSSDGTVTITYTGAVHDGGEIHLKPAVAEDGKIKWSCLGRGIPEDILPKECQLI